MSGRRGSSDELEVAFLFVPRGDPEPTEWMAAHPGWVKFPATMVPRAPDPAPAPASLPVASATPDEPQPALLQPSRAPQPEAPSHHDHEHPVTTYLRMNAVFLRPPQPAAPPAPARDAPPRDAITGGADDPDQAPPVVQVQALMELEEVVQALMESEEAAKIAAAIGRGARTLLGPHGHAAAANSDPTSKPKPADPPSQAAPEHQAPPAAAPANQEAGPPHGEGDEPEEPPAPPPPAGHNAQGHEPPTSRKTVGRLRGARSSAARRNSKLGNVPREHWEAHHLINQANARDFADVIEAAKRAGWRLDGPDNVVALPESETAREKLAKLGIEGPVHDSGHPNWNEIVLARLRRIQRELARSNLAKNSSAYDVRAREALDDLAAELREALKHLKRLTQDDEAQTTAAG